MTTSEPIRRPATFDVAAIGLPLPPSLRGDRNSIPAETRQILKGLMGARPGRFLWTLAFTWATIIGVIVGAHLAQNALVNILAVLVIATRQNVLALLLHEQVHRLGFRSRWGDFFCDLTVAYPLLITQAGYRRVHLAHHQHYFTERDPDYTRKQGREWTFPQRAGQLLRLFLIDATGLHTWQLIRSKNLEPATADVRDPSYHRWSRPIYYLLLAGIFIGTGTWPLVLLYWILPLLTVFQVIVRWAAICEHQYNLVNPSVVESTPFIRLRWWEALLLPDLNFHTYHIYHHWYPAIPYYRLGTVHEIFRREGLVEEQNIFHGYGAYWKFITRPKSQPPHPSQPPAPAGDCG